jgi:hypothetical protein
MMKLKTLSRAWATEILVVLVLLAAAPAVHAQELPALPDVDAPCAPEVTQSRRASLTHEGAAGFWFHGDVARCMLGRLSALPLYVRHVELLDQRLRLTDERIAHLEEARQLADQIIERAEGALETAMRRARQAEEDRDAWYRSPYLWFAVGVIVAGALVAVGAYALDAIEL